ncbi:MAG: aminoglycoside phosphotransferase family protein, partial [Verrucomicrobiaceae bacterium]
VRRPRTEASAFVAELLGMLREKGFEGAPVYLGIDAKGRDCFSHIAGEVDGKWHFYPDETVAAFGKLLRAFHDATRGSALAGDGRVICHHDAGPHNTVFQDGLPVALIDFDMAEPGDEIEDLAYAAWAWCISSNPARPAVEAQAAQVRLLAEAYGLDAVKRKALPGAIVERIAKNVLFWEGRREAAGADEEQCRKMIEWSVRERGFVLQKLDVFGRVMV